MANTWRGNNGTFTTLRFDEDKNGEHGNALHYEVRRIGERVEFSVGSVGRRLAEPVQLMVGGQRHGISFLLGLDQFGGFALERPALIEARYAVSHTGTLVLSPGFRKDKPTDHEDELGRVLSPTFEVRCLTCHGKPGTLGAAKLGGVRCESCHGPASAHVDSVTHAGQQLVKPTHLDDRNSIAVCAQCHSGLSASGHADPMPEDLLVSSQVPALRNSECLIQSGEKLTCTACHNPHEDSATVVQSSTYVCLRCHSLSVPQHAAICPTNRTQGCIGCHMPSVQSDSFRLTDHWIRVHPESGPKIQSQDENLRSEVIPKREFLRLIMVDSDEKMKTVMNRLSKGEEFRTVAHDLSDDATAPGGGFAGDLALADMNPQLATAAAHLQKGADSGVINVGSNWFILHRLPRDFKWDADRLYQEAVDLKDRGDRAGAVVKDQRALDVYPYLLRGLVLMGTMLGQAGDADRASAVLGFAAQFYPQDASTQFDLALTLGKQPAKQIEALRRAIEMDPDMVAAYQSLGAALYAAGQRAAAIDTFRSGLQIDPLSAVLYYDLGLALKEQGDSAGASKALGLAGRLDPEVAVRK
ncbi:MAG TPA: peptidylprolyl isomerase [Bryobacteraceae bacterium]|nr:peptidylprolyl isomerase [Bryobacteraceae bacterium]